MDDARRERTQSWLTRALIDLESAKALVDLALPLEPQFVKWRAAAKVLTPYAVIFRYPDGPPSPTKGEFNQAMQLATGIYSFVLSLLPTVSYPKQ